MSLCLVPISPRGRVVYFFSSHVLSYLPDAAREDQLDTRSGHCGAYSGSQLHNHVPIYVSYRFSRLCGTMRNLRSDKGDLDGDSRVPEALMVNKKADKFSLGLNPIYDTQLD